MIYFVTAHGLDYVKIGQTVDVESRVSNLQTAYPKKLQVWAVMNGSFQTETGIHELFKHLRKNGEWFKKTDELKYFIRAIQRNPTENNIYTLYRKSMQLRLREKALRLSKNGNRKLLERINSASKRLEYLQSKCR